MKLTEIATFADDVPAMTAFYTQLLRSDPVATGDGVAVFQVGDTRVFIHRTYKPNEGELPPENHIAFSVDDVDRACSDLQAAGARIEVGPGDYYWGRSAYLRDPSGRLIELSQEVSAEGV